MSGPVNVFSTQFAAYGVPVVDQLRVDAVAVENRQVQYIGKPLRRLQRISQLELVRNVARQGAHMLDKKVAVAVADDQAEPVVEHRQYNGVERNDHQRDAPRDRKVYSCHRTRSVLM